MQRPVRLVRGVALATALAVASGCSGIRNEPVNKPFAGNSSDAFAAGRPTAQAEGDDFMVGLAFSGGGTRAAAFSYGVLAEIDRTRVPTRRGSSSLLDHVDFVSGVSGGSVIAAYYALKKREALADFRERFLFRDAEESITTSVTPVSLVRAFSGGINDSQQFPRWLDRNLFNGATFADFRASRGPYVWINASDIYNRTPFIFGVTAFGALCSDLASYPIADAVAASAAVPVVFAPIVIRSYPKQCNDKMPPWVERARANPHAPPLVRAFADAIHRYHSGEMAYVKLLDGGLVDNFGLSGFTIARLSSETPYGPLTPEQAVRLRRSIFIIVDAGRGPSGDWVRTVEGPAGIDLVMASADTAVDASVRANFTAFERTMADWQRQLVRWRCGLSADQRRRYGARPGWNCADVKFHIARIGYELLDPARATALNQVPSRFKLPRQQVEDLIAGGSDALRASPAFNEFLVSIKARPPARRPIAPRPSGVPVADAQAVLPAEDFVR